jgi:hypothetical protein
MMSRNLVSLVLSTFLSGLASAALNFFTPLVSNYWYLSPMIFIVFCFILNLVYARRAGSKDFTQLLFACIVIKLLFALIVVVIFWLIDKKGFFSFSIHFILHYVLFTIFEIRYILFLIKNNSINPTQHAS